MIRVSIVGRCSGVCEYSFFFHAKKLSYLKNKVKINNITHIHNRLVSKGQCIQPQSILQLHWLIGRVQVQQAIKHLKRMQLNHGKQDLLLTNLIRRNELRSQWNQSYYGYPSYSSYIAAVTPSSKLLND